MKINIYYIIGCLFIINNHYITAFKMTIVDEPESRIGRSKSIVLNMSSESSRILSLSSKKRFKSIDIAKMKKHRERDEYINDNIKEAKHQLHRYLIEIYTRYQKLIGENLSDLDDTTKITLLNNKITDLKKNIRQDKYNLQQSQIKFDTKNKEISSYIEAFYRMQASYKDLKDSLNNIENPHNKAILKQQKQIIKDNKQLEFLKISEALKELKKIKSEVIEYDESLKNNKKDYKEAHKINYNVNRIIIQNNKILHFEYHKKAIEEEVSNELKYIFYNFYRNYILQK